MASRMNTGVISVANHGIGGVQEMKEAENYESDNEKYVVRRPIVSMVQRVHLGAGHPILQKALPSN
jgi:hypothetical protein